MDWIVCNSIIYNYSIILWIKIYKQFFGSPKPLLLIEVSSLHFIFYAHIKN